MGQLRMIKSLLYCSPMTSSAEEMQCIEFISLIYFPEESHSPELVGSGSTTVTAGDEEVVVQGGSPRTGAGSSYERGDGSTNGTQKGGGGGSMVSSPVGSAGAGSTENWPSQSDEDIDRLVALHQNRASLSSLGVRSDSMASVYSGAGEGRYGTVTVRGQIEFGMQYNYKQGALEIHVKQCKDLAAVDTKRNRSDPYVKVRHNICFRRQSAPRFNSIFAQYSSLGLSVAR